MVEHLKRRECAKAFGREGPAWGVCRPVWLKGSHFLVPHSRAY